MTICSCDLIAGQNLMQYSLFSFKSSFLNLNAFYEKIPVYFLRWGKHAWKTISNEKKWVLAQYLLINADLDSCCFFWIVNLHEMKFKCVWRWKFLKLAVNEKERVPPAGLTAVLKLLLQLYDVQDILQYFLELKHLRNAFLAKIW